MKQEKVKKQLRVLNIFLHAYFNLVLKTWKLSAVVVTSPCVREIGYLHSSKGNFSCSTLIGFCFGWTVLRCNASEVYFLLTLFIYPTQNLNIVGLFWNVKLKLWSKFKTYLRVASRLLPPPPTLRCLHLHHLYWALQGLGLLSDQHCEQTPQANILDSVVRVFCRRQFQTAGDSVKQAK